MMSPLIGDIRDEETRGADHFRLIAADCNRARSRRIFPSRRHDVSITGEPLKERRARAPLREETHRASRVRLIVRGIAEACSLPEQRTEREPAAFHFAPPKPRH